MEESRLLEIATKLPQFAIDKQNVVCYSIEEVRTGQDSAENEGLRPITELPQRDTEDCPLVERNRNADDYEGGRK